MFEVGFSELLMVGLVALLVIGPERLPKAARIAGYWLGRARTTVANVKAEIKQELHAEEMRQLMQQQALTEDLHKILDETQTAAHDIQQTLNNLDTTPSNDDRAT